jgi:hypothetical protein
MKKKAKSKRNPAAAKAKAAKSANKAIKAKTGVAVRTASAGRFVIGHQAFARISAVEGVVLSKAMKADLRRLEAAAPAERRMVLSGKYGKA